MFSSVWSYSCHQQSFLMRQMFLVSSSYHFLLLVQLWQKLLLLNEVTLDLARHGSDGCSGHRGLRGDRQIGGWGWHHGTRWPHRHRDSCPTSDCLARAGLPEAVCCCRASMGALGATRQGPPSEGVVGVWRATVTPRKQPSSVNKLIYQ